MSVRVHILLFTVSLFFIAISALDEPCVNVFSREPEAELLRCGVDTDLEPSPGLENNIEFVSGEPCVEEAKKNGYEYCRVWICDQTLFWGRCQNQALHNNTDYFQIVQLNGSEYLNNKMDTLAIAFGKGEYTVEIYFIDKALAKQKRRIPSKRDIGVFTHGFVPKAAKPAPATLQSLDGNCVTLEEGNTEATKGKTEKVCGYISDFSIDTDGMNDIVSSLDLMICLKKAKAAGLQYCRVIMCTDALLHGRCAELYVLSDPAHEEGECSPHPYCNNRVDLTQKNHLNELNNGISSMVVSFGDDGDV